MELPMLNLDNMDMDKIIIVLIIIIIIIVVLMLSVNKTISKPTTQGPTTQGPTTQGPTTQGPTTQGPTTQALTTQAPTTISPTTQTLTTSPIISHFITIKDFGAKGDGLTDDTTAIKNAINAIRANDAKIKTLFIPEGTYLTKSILLRNVENITIFGQNRNTTMIKLETISNNSAHVFNLMDIKNITIKGLTIDASRDAINQQIKEGKRHINSITGQPMSGGHGIRTGGSFHIGLVLDDIIIQNCFKYALGCQKGNNSNFYINNFIVQNVGSDGMDFKNVPSLNDNINITNGLIKNFALDDHGKPGLDLRGNFSISNIHIELNHRRNVGIELDRSGRGVVNNINILGAELPDGEKAEYRGFVIAPPKDYNIDKSLTFNNIYVKNAKLANIYGITGVFNNMVSENAPGDALDIGWDCSNRIPEYCNTGRNIIISNLEIKNPGKSAIIIKETAKNVIINGFNLSGIGHTEAINITNSSENIILSNGFIPKENLIVDDNDNAIKSNIIKI